ncbi:MAG: adenosylhomocysteinase [Thermoplasmata archaeon]|nr:MAG: adenosylhomocysteinase [Thermoplasmata archaeon]
MREGNVSEGIRKIEWARSRMEIIRRVGDRIKKDGGLSGVKVGMALHVEAKTAVLALILQDAGAIVRLASCNPMSTDDDVSAALMEEYGVDVYARKGESVDEYYANLNRVLDIRPNIIIDDGGDLAYLVHTKRKEIIQGLIGGCEETTTGVLRLRAMEKDGVLKIPVIDVNDASMKRMFDNRYGTGQSTIDGIISATNLLMAGKCAVVAGYGWCGRGIAMRLRGMGARVVVTEVDEVKAMEALLDGFAVMPMHDAIKNADIVVTATGCRDVVREEHLMVAKDGCILCNAGHFNVEVSVEDLEKISVRKRKVREYVEEYVTKDGRKLYLIAEGRLLNLVVGQGHPVEIMDMSFSIQALCADYLMAHREIPPGVHPVPSEIDRHVAKLALESRNVKIDRLTSEQLKYLSDWKAGT